MNCARVWGGNIYENVDFYDLCVELVRSVVTGATQQVRRIHHWASLALWCGNNELVQLNGLFENEAYHLDYNSVFHDLLPEIVGAHDGTTVCWPSSEWRCTFENGQALGEKSGAAHFWDGWHAKHPVKDDEKWAFRFCSEFGKLSYSSPERNRTIRPPSEKNVFGLAVGNHQKNRAGKLDLGDSLAADGRDPCICA